MWRDFERNVLESPAGQNHYEEFDEQFAPRPARLAFAPGRAGDAAVGGARAQSDPLPPGNVTLIVPLAAGGPTDALARVIAEKLGTRLDRTVVVENKGGAGGNIGAAAVARAEPNGLTWLFTINSVLTINPHLYASQGFDPQKDLVPVSVVGTVHPHARRSTPRYPRGPGRSSWRSARRGRSISVRPASARRRISLSST